MPLLKKPGLDRNILKNFRPISNLPFLSKVTERVVADRLDAHLDLNDLHGPLQSAYNGIIRQKQHSLKVQDDIMECLDNNSVVILLLLDLSAAFDTVDHGILLKRLTDEYGIKGTAHDWFRSYLTSRSQSVAIKDSRSDRKQLGFSVPQGSVLGRLITLTCYPKSFVCIRSHFLTSFVNMDSSITVMPMTVSYIWRQNREIFQL